VTEIRAVVRRQVPQITTVPRPDGAGELSTVWAGPWRGRQVGIAQCFAAPGPSFALAIAR
jgi:hypothetical protein